MNLVQLKKKLITVHGNSIIIRKGVNAKIIKEKKIFSKSKIKFLLLIGEKNDVKAFFLALSSKRIALFQLKKESPIVIFKLDEKIVDHGTVHVLDMERRTEGESIVKLIIPIAFHSGTVRKIRLTVNFRDSQITKQKLKFLEEMRMEDEKMSFCVDLGNDNFFGFFEDTIVKSDGLVTRAEEPSTKKKRRIAVVGRELWHGNILLATENGTIRVVRVKDDRNNSCGALRIFSEGQCVPPYCTLRCREPSVIISTENTVIVGTQRGEVHFLSEQMKLMFKIDTEGGPINCLKMDENDSDFLWVGFESGELRMLFMPDSEHNGDGELMGVGDCKRDEVAEPSVKKERSDQAFGGRCKRSETDMVCPFCDEFKTLVTQTFVMHLREIHRTTPPLAGLVFRCQCGNESISCGHSRKCPISNFTIVQKPDFGPMRTLADKRTPQCVECKIFPRSIYGYAYHIYTKHRKTLKEIGCYLKCGVCHGDFYNYERCREHPKKCKSRFYSLLKLGEEMEKKDETEMDQAADA